MNEKELKDLLLRVKLNGPDIFIRTEQGDNVALSHVSHEEWVEHVARWIMNLEGWRER